jgi:uncharacterized protein (DUF58 family)
MKNIHFTKEGRRFIIAVVLIGFASLNTGNNLIYLLFSMMLALSLISFVAAFVNLRGLDARVDFQETIYAGMPVKVGITMNNRKFFPSHSVSVELPLGLSRKLYLPVVKRGHTRMDFDDVVIRKRGRYYVRDFKLRTGFPFIFLFMDKAVSFDREIIVYPGSLDVSTLLKDVQSDFSDRETVKKGHEGDFLFSREYLYGEESRNIDWKATAKTQKTMVKEYSRRDERFATVILDNGGRSEGEAFEKAVSLSSSLCSEFIERGYYVRLITYGKVVPFGNGTVHLFKMLDILAAVTETYAPDYVIGEPVEGLSFLVYSSDMPGLSGTASSFSGVFDARDL